MSNNINSEVSLHGKPIQKLKQLCEEVAKTEPGQSNVLASHLSSMTIAYYEEVKNQAKKSFWGALTTAMLGILLLSFGIY